MSLNIGQKFENWCANPSNYNNTLNNHYVSDFDFLNQDMASVPPEKKPQVYKKAVLNIAESRISNYDANKNGKMEFDEYVKEQVTVYEKTFKEKLDLSIAGMKETLKQIFDNCDTNKDGSIDNHEMAAVFAYMDGNSNSEGKLDGKSVIVAQWGLIGSIPTCLQFF